MKLIKRWTVEVSKFRDKHPQKKYRGTWRWAAGYEDNLMPSFPIFFVEEQSHGYVKGSKGKRNKGPVIKTRKEAVAQAYEAMEKAKAKDEARVKEAKELPDALMKHLRF